MDEPFLPYGRQSIDEADIEAVIATLKSDYLTTGPEVDAFEAELAAKVGARFCVVVTNGTAALHAACVAAGIGKGDEVLVPAITFVASANCVRYCGGDPVFVDVDPESGLIRLEDVERRINERTKAIIPVHLNGTPVQLDALARLAQKHGLHVIEDAAHALGASFDGKPIGDGSYGDQAIFSFHPVKHVTTAEGGAITTNDEALDARLRRFRDHGIMRVADGFQNESPGPWYYEQQELGHNLRLSAIHCSLGRSQLKKLDSFVKRRREIVARYDAALAGLDHVQPVAKGPRQGLGAYHLYAVLIDYDALGTARAKVMQGLREHRIGTQVHYIPVPEQPYYVERGHTMQGLEGAAEYYRRVLSLPMYPTLTDAEVDRVVQRLRDVLYG